MFNKRTIFFIGLVIVMLLPVLSLAQTVDLPQTGQTICYDATGLTIPCATTGQDGDILAGVAWPVTRFTDNTDGTVTDSLTGLIWLKNANCYGTRTWSQALTDANSLSNGQCGLSDGSSAGNWRLPNINELESLVNAEVTDIGAWLISEGFVNVLTDYYWSSTNYSVLKTQALILTYLDGRFASADKGSTYNVWPVRGTTATPAEIWRTGQTTCYDATGGVVTCAGTGQDGELQEGVAWPAPRFTIVYCDGTDECPSQASDCDTVPDPSNDGVIDNLTGLMFSRDANLPGGTRTWVNALDYVITTINAGSGLCGYTDWYLPNRKEIHSLTDFSNITPALPAGDPFINLINSRYWTSTTSASLKDRAFGYNTSTGIIGPYTKGASYYVWPVRVYILPTYTLTIDGSGTGSGTVTGTNINCTITAGVPSGDCTEDYTSGTIVNLSAVFNVGSTFTGWTGGGCSGTGGCAVTMNANTTVTAGFNQNLSSISGTVTSGGPGLSGVTMTLSGAGDDTTTTDGSGNYTFSDWPDGVYTVTPSLTGYTFTPTSRSVTLTGVNVTGQDFSASIIPTTYSISGVVYDGGAVMPGVTMTLSGAVDDTTTTNASGYYIFSNLADGGYTVTPSLTGYTFTPVNRGITISGADATMQDFSTSSTPTTYSISGVVYDEGAGLAGATLTLSGAGSGTATTDAYGYYIFSSLADGDYTVTPSMTGHTFTPVSRDVTVSGANVTGQDFFTTTPPGMYSISGVVYEGGVGLGGVTLTLSGAGSGTTTTDAYGYYIFSSLADGDYTVTPSMTDHTFTPVDRSVTVSGADVIEQDFIATTGAPPTPDIKVNGSDGPVTLNTTDPLSLTVGLDAGSMFGVNADWWVAADTPFGWYYYVYPYDWGSAILLSDFEPAYMGPLFTFSPVEVLNTTGFPLPPGTYKLYFGVDTIMNGVIDFDFLYYDEVTVDII